MERMIYGVLEVMDGCLKLYGNEKKDEKKKEKRKVDVEVENKMIKLKKNVCVKMNKKCIIEELNKKREEYKRYKDKEMMKNVNKYIDVLEEVNDKRELDEEELYRMVINERGVEVERKYKLERFEEKKKEKNKVGEVCKDEIYDDDKKKIKSKKKV
jgi:hypothetical protein